MKRILSVGSLLATAGCGGALSELPEDAIERAGYCLAAKGAQVSQSYDGKMPEVMPFEDVIDVSQVTLFEVYTHKPAEQEKVTEQINAHSQRVMADIAAEKKWSARVKQCEAAYPGFSAKGAARLPTNDVDALAGCYLFTVVVASVAKGAAPGHAYDEIEDYAAFGERLNTLSLSMPEFSVADTTDLVARGQAALSDLIVSAPIAEATKACKVRFP